MSQASPWDGIKHWTAGCRGYPGFLRAVLRTLNIPIVHKHQCGHALPYFSADGLYLSHGDDPYHRYTRTDPPYSMFELLIDQSKFDSWFGSAVSDEDRCRNVGGGLAELTIQYLPTALLGDYCADQAAGRCTRMVGWREISRVIPSRSSRNNISGPEWIPKLRAWAVGTT